MRNLLEETQTILRENGKSLNDIRFVYTDEGCFVPVNGCRKFLDVWYDPGYGSNDIRLDLKLVGDGFWLERSEWWEFKSLPKFNKNARVKISPLVDDSY